MRIGGGVVRLLLAIGCIVGVGRKARADVFNLPSGQTSLQFVTVGDPGNAPDTTGFGAVPYTYQMGKFDVTVAQYTRFLNSVAQTDTYRLYNITMSPSDSSSSCGIVQNGNSGGFTYSFASDRANLPVTSVSWGDAARFCNWLANGQPATGIENSLTTEDGSYAINGAQTIQQLQSVTRSQSATYVIPSENEWYKSSYYDPTLNGGLGEYWAYPTKSNTAPSNILSATGQNNANFEDPILGFTDPVNLLTPVGSFAGSPSAYGTYDQGGDVFQLLDNNPGSGIADRGGAWDLDSSFLQSSSRSSGVGFTDVATNVGFRVAEVPEPSSICILSLISVLLLVRRRRSSNASVE